MDGSYLMPHPHIHAEAGEETLRRLERQFGGIIDYAADIIWETAVRIRNIAGSLKDDDIRMFIQPAYSGRSSRSAGHTANNYNFHQFCPPFGVGVLHAMLCSLL